LISNQNDLELLLIEQSKRGENKCLMSLMVRGTACHHDGDSGFICEIKQQKIELCLRLDGFPLQVTCKGQYECQRQSVGELTSPISSARIPPRRVAHASCLSIQSTPMTWWGMRATSIPGRRVDKFGRPSAFRDASTLASPSK